MNNGLYRSLEEKLKALLRKEERTSHGIKQVKDAVEQKQAQKLGESDGVQSDVQEYRQAVHCSERTSFERILGATTRA
jgi:hypothetical protein